MTGTEGMVGTYLSEYLGKRGHSIIPFEGDTTDPNDWQQNYDNCVFDGIVLNGIIHLAALAGVTPSIGNPELYYDNNVGSMRLMLDFANSHSIKKVLYASSSNAAEWWTNPYGTTKKMNEIQAEPYSAIGMRFHTIWPGRRDMLYAKLENNEVTYVNAGHYRDMVHVEDVSSAIQVLLENFKELLPQKVVDIGTGETVSVVDIVKASGYKGNYRTENPPGERVITQANIQWLTDLGWEPKWNILKGKIQG